MTASYNKSFIYFICLVSAMGGLLFGYDWVVIGGAVKFYEQFFGLGDSPVLQGIATSAALVGCMFGALTAGALADRYGRKPLLITAAVLFTVSAVATGLFNRFGWFCAARLLGGVGIGLASAISPMYIAEVSPADVRGRLVSLNQMTIVLGILAAQIANWAIARPDIGGQIDPWNIEMGWRWMFWAETVPAAAFLVMAFFIPESPRWTALNERVAQARAVLSRVGGQAYAESELTAIAASVAEAPAEKAGLKELFRRRYAGVLVLGIFIAVFQQWCGTNVIFIYAQDVFAGAGYSVSEAFLNIVVTGISMSHVHHYPIYITTGCRNRGPKERTDISTARDISICNVVAEDCDSLSGIIVTGMPGHPVENIRLSNISLRFRGGVTRKVSADYPELGTKYPEPAKFLGTCPAYGLFARHVKGLVLNDVNFMLDNPDSRPCILTDDVEEVRMREVRTPEGWLSEYSE